MTTSNCTIQSTFHLPEEHVSPITAESNDFFSDNGLSCSCFFAAEDQKRPFSCRRSHPTKAKNLPSHYPETDRTAIFLARDMLSVTFSINTDTTCELPPFGPVVIISLFSYSFYKKKVDLRLEDLTRRDVEAYVEQEQDKGLTVQSVKTKLTAYMPF